MSYDADSPKRVLNLSQTLEKKQNVWLKDNNKALQDYNKRIEMRSVFSDGMRNF